ncbi:MAG: hypothetical protein LH660_13315 [Phormidesmis sp. CAN_BIN36]|nr:hypothetical protein [Phormidesmis sp. CAN_BIN36]
MHSRRTARRNFIHYRLQALRATLLPAIVPLTHTRSPLSPDQRPPLPLYNHDRTTKSTIGRSPTSKAISPLTQTHDRETSAKQNRLQ